MGMGKGWYEECRVKRMEENKRRMEELKLLHLSNSLHSLRPKSKSYSIKKKNKAVDELVAVRRSGRVAGNPVPVMEYEIKKKRRRRRSDMLNEGRTYALEKAQELDSKLQGGAPRQPTLVKSMLFSYVSSGVCCLSKEFCRRHLPGKNEMVTLVDEQGNEFPSRYFARNNQLSAGWAGFVKAHHLADGDAIIFQKINCSLFKVYIVKASGSGPEMIYNSG